MKQYSHLVWFFIFGFSSNAHAWTFVGNGGNAGDVELEVAKRELKDAFRLVKEPGARAPCSCAEAFTNHEICDYLKSLNDAQTKYCAETLLQKADEIGRILSEGQVRFNWTHESVDVEEKSGKRAADAVTSREQKTITLNQERFLALAPYERAFLLAHELIHLTEVNGKQLVDEGAIGPFPGTDGGRKLINAMAAGTVMEAADDGVMRKYSSVLNRPQGWKKAWVGLSGGSTRVSNKPSGVYSQETFSKSGADFRYYFMGNFGVILEYSRDHASKTVRSTINVDEEVTSFAIGATYRYFPFKDPLTYSGQTHFVLSAQVEKFQSKINVTESDVVIDDSANGVGFKGSCSYYIPIAWGFWADIGVSLETQAYQYSKLPLAYDINKLSSAIGVSYAF
jgi:hypothetical protein